MEADPLAREKRRGIPSLDGLRAISILLVLVAHTSDGIAGTRTLGSFGVRVFFVISGFLITTLLLAEMERSGSINLRHFYFRRTLRIFPPYYIFVAVVALLMTFGVVSAPANRYWPALTYTSNWFDPHSWWLGHTWSLSVEEQFYLAWPLCMVMLGVARSRFAAMTMMLLAPALRCGIFVATRNGMIADSFNFDFIAAGCALALLSTQLDASPRWQHLMRGSVPPFLAALALGLHVAFADSYRWRFLLEMVLVQPLEAVTLAVFLAWTVRNSEGRIGRVLNAAPIRGLGIASYSVYLWQQVVVATVVSIPWYGRIACAIAVGVASYFVIERPTLELRKSLERRLATARPVVDNA